MSYSETQKRISLDADASIGIYTGISGMPGSASPNYGKQFCFVKVTGSHQAGLGTAATDAVVGVLQNKPQHVGNASEVAISGVSLIQVGTGGLNPGDRVTSDANGKGITAASGTAAFGIAIEAGVAGAVTPVLLGRV